MKNKSNKKTKVNKLIYNTLECDMCGKKLDPKNCIECSDVPDEGYSTIKDTKTGKYFAVIDNKYCNVTCLHQHILEILYDPKLDILFDLE